MEELKELHEKTGISWYRMAQELGVPYQTISNWKVGRRKPSLVYQREITKYVKKSLAITLKV